MEFFNLEKTFYVTIELKKLTPLSGNAPDPLVHLVVIVESEDAARWRDFRVVKLLLPDRVEKLGHGTLHFVHRVGIV